MWEDHRAYWLERSLQDAAKAYNFAEEQLKKLRKEYRKSIATIEKELKKAKGAEKERLEELKEIIEKELDRLFELEENLTEETLQQIYEDGYYHAIYNYQQAVGYGTSMVYIGPRAAEVVINRAWSGKNYSERIWTHRQLLGKKVEQILTQGTILGYSNAKMAKQLATAMNASFSNAARLIRTETNYVHNQATKAGYEAMGQDKYIFLATLDLRTSDTCRMLDGKKFDTKNAKPGMNFPPMHPNCRSTTIPDIEEDGEEVRLAKLNGEYYEVPASMTYEQWYKEHVVGKYGEEQAKMMEKMVANESRDRALHEQYRDLLGSHVPKSFSKFQQMKYNNSEEWSDLKALYRDVKWQVEAQENLVKGSVHKVDFIGPPNSVFDNYKDGKLISRRYYGRTGKPRLDIDFTDHGNSKEHPVIPHAHDWKSKKDPDKIKRESTWRPLTLAEEIANRDAIKKEREK